MRLTLVEVASASLVLLIVAGIVIFRLKRSERLTRQALFAVAKKVEQPGCPDLKAAIYDSAGPDGGGPLAAILRTQRD